MRASSLMAALALVPASRAQIVTSISDGDWDDPATWDCGCVPVIDDLEVLHHVRFTGNTIVFNDSVHVAIGASLFNDTPYSIAITENIVCDGAMELIGDVDIDGSLLVHGSLEVEGELHNDNLLTVTGPGSNIRVDGDFVNAGTLDGDGDVCVTGLAANVGTMQGTLDVCDGTPTTTVPPILDWNSGTVGPDVTFCVTAACIVSSVAPSSREQLGIRLDPQGNVLHLPRSWRPQWIVDATGRPARIEVRGGSIAIDDLQAGVWVLFCLTEQGLRSFPFVVLR